MLANLTQLWREKCRSVVAKATGHADEVTFAELIPRVPGEYQPLLKALVDENNELLFQVRKRARQNHMMLKRSVELMQQVMNSLNLANRNATESDDGALPSHYGKTDEADSAELLEVPVQSHAQN